MPRVALILIYDVGPSGTSRLPVTVGRTGLPHTSTDGAGAGQISPLGGVGCPSGKSVWI